MTETQTILTRLSQALSQIVVGQTSLVHQLLVALLADGHVILEGVPGTGKTLLVKVMAKLVQAEFQRIQLTPDVLPADILGTNIFDLNSRSFSLQKGPVFTQFLLADEINRTPPKTQAALLEAMEEQQVTLDGKSLPLPEPFWTIATQNPLEFEGTYPLPEAQLDRFLFKLVVDYPSADAEKQMLLNRQAGFRAKRSDLDQLTSLASIAVILQAREQVQALTANDRVLDYLLALVRQTRQHPDLAIGASPRAAVLWLQAAKAQAWLRGQGQSASKTVAPDRATPRHVTPDDIKAVAAPLLRHRLILKPEAQLEGLSVDAIISALLQQVPVPR